MFLSQFKLALMIIWLFWGLLFFFILVSPIIFTADKIHIISSYLKIEHHKKCPLCGMTTAFIAISNGKPRQANLSNPYSLIIWFFLISNNLFLFIYLIKKFSATEPPRNQKAQRKNNLVIR